MSHGTKPGNRAPSSKMGRNKTKCDRYRSQNRAVANAARKAARILKGFRSNSL
jgi:hypothetical protein